MPFDESRDRNRGFGGGKYELQIINCRWETKNHLGVIFLLVLLEKVSFKVLCLGSWHCKSEGEILSFLFVKGNVVFLKALANNSIYFILFSTVVQKRMRPHFLSP